MKGRHNLRRHLLTLGQIYASIEPPVVESMGFRTPEFPAIDGSKFRRAWLLPFSYLADHPDALPSSYL